MVDLCEVLTFGFLGFSLFVMLGFVGKLKYLKLQILQIGIFGYFAFLQKAQYDNDINALNMIGESQKTTMICKRIKVSKK